MASRVAWHRHGSDRRRWRAPEGSASCGHADRVENYVIRFSRKFPFTRASPPGTSVRHAVKDCRRRGLLRLQYDSDRRAATLASPPFTATACSSARSPAMRRKRFRCGRTPICHSGRAWSGRRFPRATNLTQCPGAFHVRNSIPADCRSTKASHHALHAVRDRFTYLRDFARAARSFRTRSR